MIIWRQGISGARRYLTGSAPCLLHLPAGGPSPCKLSTFNRLSLVPLTAVTVKNASVPTIFKRTMAGKRLFVIHPSRYSWRRFKASLHFFTMLGVIPLTAVSVYFNVFVGDAVLTEIPEGYYPKEYEYYQHPITRWLQKNIFPPPQKGYEQLMHVMDEGMDRARLMRLSSKITALQAERNDYQGYLHDPSIDSKYQDQWHDRVNHYEEEVNDALRTTKY